MLRIVTNYERRANSILYGMVSIAATHCDHDEEYYKLLQYQWVV